jgi:hypothetical protein
MVQPTSKEFVHFTIFRIEHRRTLKAYEKNLRDRLTVIKK